MADYLLPQANLSLEDQRDIFSIRCRTNDMKANIGILEYCECNEVLNNPYIFKCKNLNTDEKIYDINYILNGCTGEIKEHLKVWLYSMCGAEFALLYSMCGAKSAMLHSMRGANLLRIIKGAMQTLPHT